jgi:hypothetical protein
VITQHDIDELVEKLNNHAYEIHGNDEIVNGLVRHLIRQIESSMTQLWFYGEALKKRKRIVRTFGVSTREIQTMLAGGEGKSNERTT